MFVFDLKKEKGRRKKKKVFQRFFFFLWKILNKDWESIILNAKWENEKEWKKSIRFEKMKKCEKKPLNLRKWKRVKRKL